MSDFQPLTLASIADDKKVQVQVNFDNINIIKPAAPNDIGSIIYFRDGSTLHVKEQLNLDWPEGKGWDDKRYVLY